MVDFQSRDTSRGLEDDDEEDSSTGDTDAAAGENSPGEETATGRPSTGNGAGTDAPDAEGAAIDDVDGTEVSVAILVTDDEGHDAADAITDAIGDAHDVLGRDERTGDLDAVQTAVNTFLDQSTVDAVVTVGGVGVGLTQVTVEAVEPLLDARLPGFGELLRRRYEEREGTAAMWTRAFAGIAGSTPVFCLPAETAVARTATAELVVPELDELVAAASEP